jgi:hypothetical protein
VELDAYGDFMAACADTRLLSKPDHCPSADVPWLKFGQVALRPGYSSQRYAPRRRHRSIVRHRPPDTLIPSERPSTVLLPMRSMVDVVWVMATALVMF